MALKALTLRHPWAFTVAWCGKQVENRDWDDRLAELLGLPHLIGMGEAIAIHGGAVPRRGRNQAWREFVADLDAVRDILGGELPDPAAQFLAGRNPGGELTPEAFILPGIVAVASLAGSTRASRDRWAAQGQLHILLSNVVPLAEPVACPGARGFWNVPPACEAEVRRQVEQTHHGVVTVERAGAEWLGL